MGGSGITGNRDGGTGSAGFKDGSDGSSMFHVCCGMAQSTNKPVNCRFGPKSNFGPVSICKGMLAAELVSISWWSDMEASCAGATSAIMKLAANKTRWLLLPFMEEA